MRHFPAFALVAGIVALAAPSCSPAPRCTVANCGGCCTDQGVCARGDTAAACGKGGSMCSTCTGSSSCMAGACSMGSGGGTGTGGNTGVGGGSGTGGNTSAGGGSGVGGGTGGSTGTGGGGGMLGSCGPSNCADGCCVGAQCIRGGAQSNAQCGQGGFACLMCVSGNNCVGGQCTGSAACSAANCAGGCCSGTACLTTAQQGNGACGNSGNACMQCGLNQTCTAGTCQQAATIGSACTMTSQCASLGTGAYCKQRTSTMNATYTNGYCTIPCTTAGAACAGTQGTCIGGSNTVLAVYGEADLFCAAKCPTGGTQSTCRNGYSCYGDMTGGFCWLSPVPAFDGGGIPDKLGNPCTLDSQCINPPSAEWGFCITQTLSNGQQGRFTGGYCTAECTYDNTGAFCGPQGSCRGFVNTLPDGGNSDVFGLCIRTCNTPGQGRSALRPGGAYVCLTRAEPDGGSIGILWPACDQPSLTPSNCPANTFCNTTNGYCCDGGNCIR